MGCIVCTTERCTHIFRTIPPSEFPSLSSSITSCLHCGIVWSYPDFIQELKIVFRYGHAQILFWPKKWGNFLDYTQIGLTNEYILLCRAMACFERNLHTQISSWDSVLSTTFCMDHIRTLLFCSMAHYDITIGNDVARDVHCDITMGYDVAMGTYHDVTMHTDVARTIIYVLVRLIMIFLFS